MKKVIAFAMFFLMICPYVLADDDDDDDDGPLPIIPLDNLSDNKFRPEVKAVFESGLNDDTNGGGGIEFVGGLQLDDHWKVGPGVGILGHDYVDHRFSSTELPVFIQARYDFKKDIISPYVLMQVGEVFGGDVETDIMDEEYNYMTNELGFFGKVSVGIDVKLKRGRFFFDVGYKIQQVKLNDDWEAQMSTPQYCSISMGYVWVPRVKNWK